MGPGPGAYSNSNVVGKDGPSIGMGIKNKVNLDEKER
jgi:hypothetical protein